MSLTDSHLFNFHLPVVVIGNEVPEELKNININWYFVYKEEVDKIDLTQFAVVIINGFFSMKDEFIEQLKKMVMQQKLGIIFKKNESISNKMGFTRGTVKHFYNFRKTNCRLHNKVEHPISTRYAFLTMNNKDKASNEFSYCYYLSLNNLVTQKSVKQLDNSAYGYTLCTHEMYPVVYYFLEYEKDRAFNYKIMMLSCLKWISQKIQSRLEQELRNYIPRPRYEIVETKQKRSDVKFRIGDKVLYANKQLLAYQSKYYEALLFGPMKESKQDEIEIVDLTYEAFRSILLYMITGETDINENNVCELLVNCDRFGDLEGLRNLCTKFLIERLIDGKESLENVWKLLKLASLHKCDKVLEVCSYCVHNNQKFFKDKLNEIDKDNPLWFFLCKMYLNVPIFKAIKH